MQLLNTLYVTQPESYLHLDNNTLRIEIEHETRLRVPLHHLSSVVCFGHVMISPILMHRLAEEGQSLVLLDGHGRFKARLEGPVSGNVLLRQAQYRRVTSADFCVAVAKSCIAGKLKNCRQVLLRGARENGREEDNAALIATADELARALARLEHAPDLDAVRGIEGDAAKRYFVALRLIVRPDARADFTMNGRTRRPPLDRMNALLSFLYAMLMNDVRSAVESVGLDPQIGFLHAVRPGRAALALDLMEEFRPLLADRLALTLINRKQIKGADFIDRPGGAVTLKDDARKAVVTAYQERKQETLTHPLLETSVALGLAPFVQARLLARTVRGDVETYLPFCPK
ncbi:MAG: type I-C CRISPR-associated endonuclease Cas1c [Gammaproteobacteria bacterium]|nr:type I-C CRISPR-associated endonuclease Cas1 [Rhodocyclaceae bacterium]MBU3908044.1 type I-C CRISPR-associated endonuclease Cas1c [Gammaproteobacteria bacterium]MBU3990345.1 type I-C CRISPR-associated endonuclease Cas1c [Gammaproteobacteria bacterium]MBU4006001.1 type I-C CRISPR-associated endonuclease Cas1c [Gammaproteobacteria bacterium]MBU4022026.1 type I-C CRISPR-associated endonuclease Cas1c [Gammaproteobacteria bacterium]